MKTTLVTIFFGLLTTSCAFFKGAAIAPVGSIIYDASFEQMTENDWEYFENSLISNIKLVESLLSQDPDSKTLKVTLIKALAAKAFAIDETAYLEDRINEVDDSIHKKKALISYTKALKTAASFYEDRGLEPNFLSLHRANPEKVITSLEDKLSDDILDVEAVFYTAQSMAAVANLSRDNMRIIAYLPVAKALFDWACGKKPDLNGGACDIFYAGYMAQRPRMLGGNPDKGKELFEKAIVDRPENYLVRQSFVEMYLIPFSDDEGYEVQKNAFSKLRKDFKDDRFWSGEDLVAAKKSRLSVFNMIALKRMNIIEKLEEDIF